MDEVNLSYKKYRDFIKDDLFFRPYGDHGIGHSRRVLYLAYKLAEKYNLSEHEWKLLAIACCYHDIGRTNDASDELHGLQSIRKMIDLKLDEAHCLSEDEFDIVATLIIYHAMPDKQLPDEAQDRVLLMYKIIKDADGLDRMRFGDLDTKYLRLEHSKELLGLELRLLIADNIIKK